MKTAFLKGNRVGLRSLAKKDARGPYVSWFNDAAVCQFNSHHLYPFSQKDAEDYIEQIRRSKNVIALAIETLKEKKHIGNLALKNIDLLSKSAEFAIILGEPKYWGKGYGFEALSLILQHGFQAFGLRRIYAGTFSNNQGMIKLAKKLGMKQEGIRRQAAFKDGKYLDVIEFGLLKDEFKFREV